MNKCIAPTHKRDPNVSSNTNLSVKHAKRLSALPIQSNATNVFARCVVVGGRAIEIVKVANHVSVYDSDSL